MVASPSSTVSGSELEAPICVFAPSLFLSVTIEGREDGPEAGDIHLHPGGQGFWIARLLSELGGNPILCGPVGGEAGAVLNALIPDWGIPFEGVRTDAPSPCHISDRRGGERQTIARDERFPLERHEVDNLYGRVLELSLEHRRCVMTGRHPGERLPVEVFGRLGADLRRMEVMVIGDLHGRELHAFLEEGSLELLKVSDEDLEQDGLISDRSEATVIGAMKELASNRIEWLVVSRGEEGSLMLHDGVLYRAQPARLEVVDPIGAGDSMSAALVSARIRGLDAPDALRLASAAGAANVTRHGLASASAALIEQLAEEIDIEEVRST